MLAYVVVIFIIGDILIGGGPGPLGPPLGYAYDYYSIAMEKVKVQKKRAPRWSEVEIDALVTAVESNRKQILGSFSSEVTLNSKQNAWKIVAFKVSWCFSSSVLSRSLGFLHYIITVSLLRNIVLNLFDVKRVSRGL